MQGPARASSEVVTGLTEDLFQRFKNKIGTGACHLQLASLQVLQVQFFDVGVSFNASAARPADLGKQGGLTMWWKLSAVTFASGPSDLLTF